MIATSFRPACNTPGVVAPCFDDNSTNVNTLCNQGTSTQVVQCFYATGSGTSQNVESGLQFIHGYGAAQESRTARLTSTTCGSTAASLGCSEYFNATTTACGARLNAAIDLGSVMQGTPPVETRTPAHAEVRYKIVYGKTGPSGSVCGNFPSSGCDLTPGWSTSLNFAGLSGQNAIAIRVRLNNTRLEPAPARSTVPQRLQQHLPVVLHRRRPLDEYPDGPVHLRQPAPALVHGRPHHVGRHLVAAFVTGQPRSGSCTPTLPADPRAANATNGMHCFYMEMGMRGGLSRTRTSRPSRSTSRDTSQHQLLDCDPNIAQGQIAEAVRKGCGPFYASNRFDTNPLCPDQTTSSTCPTRVHRGTTGRRFGA